MGKNEEQARKVLENEFNQNPYVLNNPLGKAVSNRKIYEYIASCIKDGLSCSECKEKLQSILKENGIDKEIEPVNVNTELNVRIDGIYGYINLEK